MKRDYANLSVLIPAHNEQDAIASVIEDLHQHVPGCQILVVDDCSKDSTPEVAMAYPDTELLQLSYNQGYGGALRQGTLAATRELIAWFDGDNEHRAEDLARMVDRLEDERLGAVLGQRGGSVSSTRGIGKMLIRLFALLLGLGYVKDFNCGLRVFRREAYFRFFLLLPTGYSASTTSTFLLIKSRIPFAFEQIELRTRVGQSKVKLFDGFRTLVTVLRIASLLQPLRLFGSLAGALFAAGLAYSALVILYNGQGLPVLGALLLISSLLVMTVAIIADQIGLLRLQHCAAFGLNYLANWKKGN
ncbi:glycosyltransferase family 2 protein [Shinella oryzae]|uniref:glycosyltransferase family 2 protein n=1 Tax=Shinella oryzae TaxID=2871820 RepID=UPI001FF3C3FB|nr:glycosyltransferase family 2 protein [Shinella oryzae]UPA25215.1 glycosyltransferase family 2 protein [Shinella oryzae]